jgi:hypothetical protein
MKLLMLLSLCIGTRLVFSQTYYPISDTNAVWDIVLYPDPEDPYPPMHENHFKYRLKGDTLINSITYQKLIRTYINTLCSIDTSTETYGYMRNDIESRKVYYRYNYQTEESLLYDFSLQIGDTLKGSVFENSDEFTVSAIDSILINDNYHKRYSINLREFFMYEYLIEGIGTTIGLIERVSEFWPFYKLRCFSENGQLGYLDPWATECRLETDSCYVGIGEITNGPKVLVIPNPAKTNELFSIDLSKSKQEGIKTIDLYDIRGRKLVQIISPVFPLAIKSPEKAGLYFLRLSYKDGNQNMIKVVVNN